MTKSGTTPTLLATLFSEESKANYERVNKPTEFIKKRKLSTPKEDRDDDVEGEEEQVHEILPKKVKKPKHKHRNQNKTESSSNISETQKQESSNPAEVENNEKDERTIFVGNIPITETSISIRTYFGQFGPVESVRLRSVPTAGTAVDVHGNQNLVKKVCIYQGKYGDQKGSFNAYVVFKSKASAEGSLAANNRIMGSRHLRVDSLKPTLYSPKTSVFLGGLPFYTDEEELREHFAKILPNGQDDISGIRIIRDQETLVGKGIGYLALASHEAVMRALSLDKSKFKKREIRVTSCGKRTKRTEQQKRQTSLPATLTTSSSDSPVAAEGTTNSSEEPPKKRKKDDKSKPNPALRRMEMKKAIQQIVKKNAKKNSQFRNKKKAKPVNVKQAVRKLERMNKKK